MTGPDHAADLLARATAASLTEAARVLREWRDAGNATTPVQARRLRELLEEAARVRLESVRLGRQSAGFAVRA